MGRDTDAKRAFDKRQMVFVAFKLFRRNGDRNNDQAIIDFLDGKNKSEVIKNALREYMTSHPKAPQSEENTPTDETT